MATVERPGLNGHQRPGTPPPLDLDASRDGTPEETADRTAVPDDGRDTPNGAVPHQDARDGTPEQPRDGTALPAVRPADVPAITGRVVAPWERPAEIRPVLPNWMTDPDTRTAAVQWGIAFFWHEVRYQGVRVVAVYPWRLAWNAPRGAVRAGGRLVGWITDAQAEPLRVQAVVSQKTDEYLKLDAVRRAKVKVRLITSGIIAAGLAAAGMAAGAAIDHAGHGVPAAITAGAAAVIAAGAYGRRASGQRVIDSAVIMGPQRRLTPDMLVRAFIARKLCKEDGPIRIVWGPFRHADGWVVVLELPENQTALDAIKQRVGIAAALRADETRLFLERVRGDTGHAGMLELYLADRDPYAKLPPVTPLADIEELDFWEPWPFGIDARGRQVNLTLAWSGLLIGAIPRQGKTFAARLPTAAGSLDPHMRIIAFNGKGDGAWKAFKQVAHRYGSGIRTAVVEHLVATLEEEQAEMNRRNEYMETLPDEQCPDSKLTRAMSRNPRLNMAPTLIAIDEIQRYLEHKTYGKRILELLIDIAKVGPSAGYWLILATQRPAADVIPPDLTGLMGIRFAMRVMSYHASNVILGPSASKAGLDSSTLLSQHKGVGILLGTDDSEASEEGPRTVRTYLADAAVINSICERGRQLRERAGTLTGVAAGEDLIAEAPRRSLLEDVLAVFGAGEKKLWSATICERLAEMNPQAYDGWDPTILANALRAHGVETKQVWLKPQLEGENPNRNGVFLEQILEALGRDL